MPTSCSHYFREAAAVAERQGLNTDAILDYVGVSRTQIEDLHWRGDITRLASMVAITIEALDDEFMGCIDDRSRPGSFAMMAHTAVHERTLKGVLRKSALFYSLMTEALVMRYDEDALGRGRWAVAQSKPELDPGHYFLDFWIMINYRLWTWLIGETPQLESLELSYVPHGDHRADFRNVFPCPLKFGAPTTTLVLSHASLSRPVIRTRNELKEFLAASPLGVMKSPGVEFNIVRKVRALIRPVGEGPIEFPAFSQVASQLYLAEQTLRRRLRNESTSYRAIKEEVRLESAVYYLRSTVVPVHEIAQLVGYSEDRAFTRAFRGWTGMSPTQYRNQAPGGSE